MNNMDESLDAVEESPGGISRRDMIKASVVTGALVWSAPLLLSGRAAADPADTCCTNGTRVTVKVTSASGANCQGNGCIDDRATAHPDDFDSFAAACQEFVGCINSTTLRLFTVTNFGTNTGATIYVRQGITVVSVGALSSGNCVFADCPCFATVHGPTASDADCPNRDIDNVSTGERFITVETGVVIPAMGLPNPPGPGTYTVIDIAGLTPLNTIQITLCLSPQVTGMCPPA